ncbi:hypothetical protein PENTCL1PPCAC_15728, partial [Pristionchus entomophagus]
MMVVVIFSTPPMLFNSTHHMLFFDPMIYEDRFVYESYIHISLVIGMPFTSFGLYTMMLIGLLHQHGNVTISKMRGDSSSLNRASFQIILQSGLVICTHLGTCL